MSSFWDTPTTPSAPAKPVGGEPSIENIPMPSFGTANSTPIFGAPVASKIPSTIPGGTANPSNSFWDVPAPKVKETATAPAPFVPQPSPTPTGQTISATPETMGSKIFGALPTGVQDAANWFNEKVTGKSAIPQAPDLPSGLLKDNPLVPFLTSSNETKANKLQQELIDRGVDPKRAADVAMYDTYQRPGQNQPLQRGQADQKIALTPDEKSAIGWRSLMNVGGVALDVGGVLPIGSISKTATIAEDIARSTDATHIATVLQKEVPNITPEVAQASANALRDINDAKSVETVLNRLNYKFNAPKTPVAETGSFWDQPKAELPAPLIEGQSSTIGTTRSTERAAQKSADYTARQSTFAPISEADNAAIKARIETKAPSINVNPEFVATKENQVLKIAAMNGKDEAATKDMFASLEKISGGKNEAYIKQLDTIAERQRLSFLRKKEVPASIESTPITTLPKEISVQQEAKAVGAKRLAPDRVAHQQMTPQAGIEGLVGKAKDTANKNAQSWTTATDGLKKLVEKYGEAIPARTPANIAKYPGLESDFSRYSSLKKYAHNPKNTADMIAQFEAKAARVQWNAEKEAAYRLKVGSEYKSLVKADISKGYKYPPEVLKHDPSFTKAVDVRARYEKGLATSFSADDSRIVFEDVDTIGAGMKRQDGKILTEAQKNEIKTGVVDFANVLGLDMKKLAEDNRWVYVHLNNKNPFLMKDVAGLYRESKAGGSVSISVGGMEGFDSIVDGEKVRVKVNPTMAHELGHAIDYKVSNKLFNRSFVWDRAKDYKPVEFSSRGSKYWSSSNEVTARMIEEYVSVLKGHEGFFTREGYWSKDIFEKDIAPAVREAIDTHFAEYRQAVKVESMGVSSMTKGESLASEALVPTKEKPISEIDRLIAQGKIRVVSRDGRDIYQTKQGSKWVNSRNEDSAVAKVTKVIPAKAPIELPQSLEEEKLRIEMKKEVLDNNPAKGLGKLVTKRGEFAGGLNEVGGKGTGKWAKEGDQIANDLGFADSEEARVAYADYQSELAALKDQQSYLKDQIKEYKIQQATEARVTKEKGLAPVRETAKVEIPQIQGTGEARTLERTAQEQLSREGQGGSPDIWPLDKMIVSLPGTPLKAKVNMLDYIRTPDKVLQKIGLAKEAEVMRVGYEGYLKELPKNIDKITAWSKEVPKAANERIFKWLDGQAIDLAPNELKVGEEIKTWLNEWADRLGMPKDDRIATYITHIFDDQLIKKEFDEDLAKIIADKIPSTVYDPFLQRRLGAQGYRQDTWAALDAYVKRATRKVHMDPALTILEDAANGLEKSQWDYVKNYVDRVNMRPTDIDNLLDNGVKQIIGYRFGQRPTLAVTRVLRQATYRGMLGLNVGSALRNLSQGMNTYAKLGEKYTALGYVNMMKSGAGAELEREGVLAESFIQDRAMSSTKKAIEKVDKALFYMFQTVEHINRGSAYFGAKAMALNSGKTEEQAIIFAKKIVRDTQFVFGSIDTPLILSSDIAKTLGQFQTFTTKQIEFLAEMAKNKEYAGLVRYVIGGLAFTYTIGQAFGMSPSDLIPMYRIGTPPSLKLPVELTKAVVNAPDQYGRQKTVPQKVKSVTDTLWGYVPAGIQIKKTIEGSQAVAAGGVQNKLGRLQFKTGDTMAAKAQTLAFGKYASPQAQDYFNGVSRAERLDMELQKLSPAEANARFAEATKNDPALADQLRKVVEDRKLGLTPEEKQIRSMGVLDGSRAKFIDDQLNGLKTREEKNARYQELVTKKIITDKVAVQIQALIGKRNINTQ